MVGNPANRRVADQMVFVEENNKPMDRSRELEDMCDDIEVLEVHTKTRAADTRRNFSDSGKKDGGYLG